MKITLFVFAAFSLTIHAEAWTPVFTCANGAFEIDQWDTEQLAIIRDANAIAYFQQQAGTTLELNTDGAIELRDSNSKFDGWVDADLVHKRADAERDQVFQIHGRPARGGKGFDLKLNQIICTRDGCSPSPGPELGVWSFNDCSAL